MVDTQGGTVTHAYDDLDRLTSETTPQGSVAYTWDAAGRRSTMTVAGQPQVSYGFDADDRLTTITQGASQVGFSYDAAGRRATLTLPNGIVATYTYNNANQLTAITYNQGATLVGDLAYSYDIAGRRTQIGGSLARTNLPSAVASATYNAANRLTNWAGTNQSYDLNGNLTGDGAKTYTWDSRNRLTALSGGSSASFAYDGLDRRTGKTVSGVVTNFLYDGINPVQELTGTTPKANLLTGLGVDEFFTRSDTAGTRTLLTDALGSTLALTDGAGAVQTSYTYAPYGETAVSGAANSNALQYTGRENDGTGLYYYRARYYDPVKSRFAAEDLIGLAGGINLYGYVNGSPVSKIDPLGLDSAEVFWGGTLPSEGPGLSQTQYGWMQFSNDSGTPYATIPIHSGYGANSANESQPSQGRTPSGDYVVTTIRSPYQSDKTPFQDKAGTSPWYAPLNPTTSMPNSRCEGGSCGIHPDGNVRGTAGCQGLAEPDTKNSKEILRRAIQNSGGNLPVHVE